jgi:hypothetical protein
MQFNIHTIFDRSDEHSDLDRDQRGKAFVHLWSTLSEATHRAISSELEAVGINEAVTTYSAGDFPAGRSVHQGADRARTSGRREVSDIDAALADRAEVLTFMTPDGTGMTGVESLQPYYTEPLDAITRFLVVSPEPTDRERICRAFNLATLGRKELQNVFISKASHDETPKYPRALASIGATAVFIDTTNLFEPALTHETVPARGVSATRRGIERAILRGRAELGRGPSDLVGFDPADWFPPSVSPDEVDVWGSNTFEARLVIPSEYEKSELTERLLADDDDIRLKAKTAPVDEIRVLLTRELTSEFVRTVKTSNIEWLYRNADSLDDWRKEISDECSPTTDPQEEVADFLVRELNVYDEEVLDTLREAGADV